MMINTDVQRLIDKARATMSNFERETIECPICHEQHEAVKVLGTTYLGCPQVPENLQVPFYKRDPDGKLEFFRTPTSNAR